MNWPSIVGWINIVALSLNALGVLTLLYFRPLSIGGYQSHDSLQALAG